MWIRTQDKKGLIKCDNLGIETFYNEYRIYEYLGNSANKVCLGEYHSEDTALEVLDDIEKTMYKILPNNEHYVYDMPKDRV